MCVLMSSLHVVCVVGAVESPVYKPSLHALQKWHNRLFMSPKADAEFSERKKK